MTLKEGRSMKVDGDKEQAISEDADEKSSHLSGIIMALFLAAAIIPFALASLFPEFFKHHMVLIGVAVLSVLAIGCIGLGWIFANCRQGILIDRRNMISLSKLQIISWTLLVVSGFIMIAASKMAYGIPDPLNIDIPEALWAVMGISTVSFIGSPILKGNNMKPSNGINDNEKNKLALKDGQVVAGTEVVNENAQKASFSDLFRGEEVGNFKLPDLGKIQMFLFTLMTWAAYALFIYELIIKIPENAPAVLDLHAKLLSVASNETLHQQIQMQLDDQIYNNFSFPDLSGGMTGLLAISNAGYLAFKALPRETAQGETTKPNPP
jgi:hypothetical protein